MQVAHSGRPLIYLPKYLRRLRSATWGANCVLIGRGKRYGCSGRFRRAAGRPQAVGSREAAGDGACVVADGEDSGAVMDGVRAVVSVTNERPRRVPQFGFSCSSGVFFPDQVTGPDAARGSRQWRIPVLAHGRDVPQPSISCASPPDLCSRSRDHQMRSDVEPQNPALSLA